MRVQLNNWVKNSLKVQIVFWVCYFLFEWLNTGAMTDNFERALLGILYNLPLILLASYLHLYITIDKFLLKNRMLPFVLIIIASVVVFGVLRRYINYNYIYPLFIPEALNKPLMLWPKIFHESMQLHLVVTLFLAVNLFRNSIYQQKLNDQYKQEKLEAEYHLLQSQVQPHFLFNTLNNLVSVSLSQPQKLPDLLQRLAGLLSYQLHESHQKMVSIKKEMAYLQDYIALEKIRYGTRLDIQTNFDDWKTLPDFQIPPMLLLPFVENAFKHGAAQTEENCWIQIRLNQNNSRLSFVVENSLPTEKSKKTTSGLGLENLKRRLEILYPENFELLTLCEDSQYLATLKFNIN